MDVKAYLGIFLRRWWLIVLSMLVAMGLTYRQNLGKPTVYSASARLLYEVNTVANSILGQTGMFQMNWTNPVDTQIKLVNTRPNALEVIRRLGLDRASQANPMSPEAIMGSLSASVDPNTNIILLGYSSLDPMLTIKIVNEAARVFVERERMSKAETARQTREFIEQQLAKTEKLLNDAENQLKEFRLANLSLDPGTGAAAFGDSIQGVDKQLITLDVDRYVAQAQLDDAKRHLTNTDPGLALRMEKIRADAYLQSLISKLNAGEAELTVARTRLTDAAPEVVVAQGDLGRLRQAVQDRIRHLLGRSVPDEELQVGLTSTEQKYLDQLLGAQAKLLQLEVQEKALARSRGVYVEKFHGYPEKNLRMQQLMRQQRAAEESYNVFYKRMQELRVTESVNTGEVRIVEEAAVANPTGINMQRTLALASLTGFMVGLAIAVLLEFLDDRIRRPEDAQHALELPILGMVPYLEARLMKRGKPVVLDDPRSPVTEAYRALQTYIRLVDPERGMQAVLITSPGPKEGKSTVAANLAATMAQLGRRTLLVDADLRAPTAHEAFGLPEGKGLTDVVLGQEVLEEVIQATELELLDLLPAGPMPNDPMQVLHAEAFHRVLEKLKRDYEAIVFDAPPINLFSDAAVLGRAVDGVLLVVDVRATTRAATSQAKDLLGKAKAPLLGMVVKNVPVRPPRTKVRYQQRYYVDRLKTLATEDASEGAPPAA